MSAPYPVRVEWYDQLRDAGCMAVNRCLSDLHEVGAAVFVAHGRFRMVAEVRIDGLLQIRDYDWAGR